MKLKILQAGDPLLRQPARELSREEIHSESIQQLIRLMRETMREAPGVGLAAPQVGESLQLIVIEDRQEYMQAMFSPEQLQKRERIPIPFHVIINPKMTIEETDIAEFHEGCLSVAGFVALTPRVLKVKVECLNEQGEPTTLHARGWYARILQHEIDHLNGTLYIDRMNTKSFTTLENYQKHWKNL